MLYLAHSIDANGGGMERMGRALIEGAADRVAFTVVASEGLADLPASVRTVRVALPRRPAWARIAWFAVRGSVAAMRLRRSHDLVHSCGAVMVVPTDLVTVHLCHAAAVGRPTGGPRWRRANAWVARRAGLVLERRGYRRGRVRELVAVSPVVADELTAAYPGVPVVTVPNGVDVARWRAAPRTDVPSGPLRVVMVTGDFAIKGVDVAIGALGSAPGVTLTVVGRGPIEHYERLARQASVADRVTFTGPVAELGPLYQSSDVVLCVSVVESFGLYLVEAALGGCAVVSTDVGVARELIGTDEGGWLVERSVDAIATALRAASADRAAVLARGATAAQRASGFSIERMVDGTVAEYERLGSR